MASLPETTYFSDYIVKFLSVHGFDKVVFNPGASFRGIHDSLVFEHNQDFAPEIVMACHEEIAVAIAHGYYKASGKHMAVLIHANVGLLHASMAIFNAWCDRVPLFMIAGNGPIDAAKRRPWIDWIHTSAHLPTAVNEFVKWSDQPTSQVATVEALFRARKIMEVGVPAPVLVAVDFDVQEQPLQAELQASLPVPEPLPLLGGLDAATSDKIAQQLLAARAPVIVLDFSGRAPATIQSLIAIAELTQAVIIDRGNRFNFPSRHLRNGTQYERSHFVHADLVLAIEVQDLEGALLDLFPGQSLPTITREVTVTALDCNDLLSSKWAADYQRHVPHCTKYIGATQASLESLLNALQTRHAQPQSASLQVQKSFTDKALLPAQHAARALIQSQLEAHHTDDIPHVSVAVQQIGAALADTPWVLTNSGSLTVDGWVKKLWHLERPNCYLGLNGGGGLGYGLGASIGAALALKDEQQLCVNLQSDGDFLYTPSGLWTLSAYNIPLLIIVMNNQLYFNSTQHAARVAGARNRDIDKAHIATSFYENPVDFVQLAQSFNIKAYPVVNTAADIIATVHEAVAYISQHGKPAVVELLIQ
ncbi:thiamine pyrophosphate-dependent enzyme [Pseudomonas sp. 5P_3.1_Bac2]|uniref:thiamine pyrophosphate-dependent enzyme n=1 Tax=Pseudomonas sp. 5P_3.1_Bac2 TaxID=2971617 RepID=UPI0021C97489|nr:thiamine pyrophosphate-dependent enzyme [Pseudomonas sp. 5P_3.1_Bac2]MCU1717263.1 thiamine pyrophosphate-binding protein [Pseudomonas sp. 5P_3.1_Bac2]